MFAQTSLLLALTAAFYVCRTNAGIGANMQACACYAISPKAPVEVQLGAVGSICVLSSGNPANVTVTSSGCFCTSIGYLEKDTQSFECYDPKYIWFFSWTMPGKTGGVVGTVGPHDWYIAPMVDGQYLCPAENLDCTDTQVSFTGNATSNLAVIFKAIDQISSGPEAHENGDQVNLDDQEDL